MALTFIPTSYLPRSSLGIIEGERKEAFSKALVLSWVITRLAKSTERGGYTAVKDGGQSMRVSYLEYRSSYLLHTGTQGMWAEWWGNYEDDAFRSFVKVKMWFFLWQHRPKLNTRGCCYFYRRRLQTSDSPSASFWTPTAYQALCSALQGITTELTLVAVVTAH